MKGVAAAEQTLLRPERFSAHTSPDLVPRVAETHEKSRVTREKPRVTPEKSRMRH
jgi:hypothetical protein